MDELTDKFLEEKAKFECQNTWKNLTSISPKQAVDLMDTYERAYKECSKMWNASQVDLEFNSPEPQTEIKS